MSIQAEPHLEPIVVRSVEISDPGDLIQALPVPGISWVRRGDGMVAWGEAARLDVSGTSRIVDAQRWWKAMCSRAIVRDGVGTRGSGLVAFGSFSFSADSATAGAIVVPQYILGRREGRAWLTIVSTAATISTPSLKDLLGDTSPCLPIGPVEFSPGDPEAWRVAVLKAVGRIEAGEVDKVVLARAITAVAAAPVDVRTLLASLAREYPTCWTFHIDGMVGATPELLARVDRGLVTSRVLAGTIRPTGDETADLAHAASLARSSKDREEHEYAVDSVTRVLNEHCSSINVPEAPSVMHLPNVMHLVTDVTGVLADNTTSLDLVAALHPSAAVCGTPTDTAAALIARLEGLDRGRYAGPVGWIDAEGDGEWCIALRTAEIDTADPRSLRLFAGCGIVAASDPDDEWAESEAKLEPLRSALGPDQS
ncbi:MAG: isochorismate synthase [Demequinaceae bacterium]|nr:isochorismate synthase [Demequinaceae bacterium]